jgi:arylsulfatase A-like enzyme
MNGETQIETPNIDRLAAEGVNFTNALSTCPVCVPYRSMLVTGRHPQTTGHVVNMLCTRHSEIGIGDAFSRAGYRTGWVGKWHLHTGNYPSAPDSADFVPAGRDRLGFEHWRAYNFHTLYFNGFIHGDEWKRERWEGYETTALNRYAFEFMDADEERPFCLFVSPHQPHVTHDRFVPEEYYERLPEKIQPPPGVPAESHEGAVKMYREYLAMILTIDDMVGDMYRFLEERGLLENTLFLFGSDHGTEAGAHEVEAPWRKMRPYENCIRVPLIGRLPGVLEGGRECDALVTPVDLFPTLAGTAGVPVPRSVEGVDLSGVWRGESDAPERDAALTMNFVGWMNDCVDGLEWRGARTKTHSYIRRRDGRSELYELASDPWQLHNLAGTPEHADLESTLSGRLDELLAERNDEFLAGSAYADWFDEQRRVIRNAHGELSHPETIPDWSLLR